MRNLLTVCIFALSAFAVGCTTHSSGGNGGDGGQNPPQTGGQQGDQGQQGGRARTTAWQCAVQFENGIVACGTYTSAASDEALQQHCLGFGQPVQACPVNNFQLTCLLKVPGENGSPGADIRFRMAGTPDQREAMAQICRQNNGQVQR